MKIKALTTINHGGKTLKRNTVTDEIADDEAKALIEIGYAKATTEAVTKEEKDEGAPPENKDKGAPPENKAKGTK